MDCCKDSQDLWHVGEKCLAPYSENEELHEAVVKTIEHLDNSAFNAVVLFLDSTEKRLPLSDLQKFPVCSTSWNTSMFDDEDLEKPFFPDKKPPGPVVDFPLSNTGISIPFTINRYLRDYQREGARFLYEHYSRSTGCILGDDMGLGKTIQVISFLAAVLQKKGTREDIENNMPEFLLRTMKKDCTLLPPKKVFLIVSPLSVLYNWKDELETWGYFKVTVIHGNKKDFELSRIKQGKYEISLTTYETLRLCLDELNSINWAAVIVDEAHRIKNPKARVTQVMKDLNCKVRFGLTGTILQNNMEELWCVMDWAVLGCLGSKQQFKEDFVNPVEYGQRHNATKRELATGRKAMQRLASKMSPLFLRRTKALISSQLPKKEDRIVYCSLSEFQKAVYQTVLVTEDVSLVLQGAKMCSCNSGKRRRKCCYKKNKYGESVRTLYFSYLAILRKVANHAALLQTDSSTSKKQEAHIKRVCDEVFSKFPEFVQQSKDAAFETISDPKYSGKMKVLQQLLNHCRKNNDKVLLFSFSTKLLDVLERYCMASGLDYRRLDGSTKPEERLKIVKEFNRMQEVNICLVSTMAGGLGLNFVGANVVVVFDPTWNPANDLQAIDRAYRIGQCRDVKVFRLISLGTVEEMIYLRQVYKQQLHCVVVGSENAKRYFEAVQGSKEHKGELFGVHNLFRLRTQGTCLTRDILEREVQVEAGVMTATMYLSQEKEASGVHMPVDTDKEENNADVKLVHQFKNETFDFSSDSDEEVKRRTKLKFTKSPATADCQKQLTLYQCGFSKMLEKGPNIEKLDTKLLGVRNKKTQNQSNSDMKDSLDFGKTSNISELRGQTNTMKNHGWKISSDSEDDTFPTRKGKPHVTKEPNVILETESSSYESNDDDVILSSQMSENMGMEKSALRLRQISESDGSDLDYCIPSTSKRQTTNNSSDYISDESDDITIPKKTVCGHSKDCKTINQQKSSSCHSNGVEKDTQTIDTFSSSDDDSIYKKKIRLNNEEPRTETTKYRYPIKSKLQRLMYRSNPSTLGHMSSINDDNGKNRKIAKKTSHIASLDNVLDGVEGVAYIHSNQNVVGSSKAENHLSRRAVQDVFELNQFSQLPANITASQIKAHGQDSSKGLPLKQVGMKVSHDNLSQHPVIHKQKKVHRTDEITFIVGETPKAMQRKQFDEMVTYFKMASAEELAHHVLNVESNVRQDMLREFYSSQYIIEEHMYPHITLSANLQKEKSHQDKKHKDKIKVKRKKIIPLHLDQINEAYKHDSATITDSLCKNSTQTCEYDAHQNTKDVDISPNSAQEKIFFKKRQRSEDNSNDTLNATDASVLFSSCDNKPVSEELVFKPVNRTTNKDKKESQSVTNLLGDTSILDDLFASQTNRQVEGPVRPLCEQPATKAKCRPKDFWDILSEQNDESLNKLTDLSVIEKACERTVLPRTSKKDNWDDTQWVKNEKFLWRKNNQSS
ncbi:DNA excision repair ERCC-6-like 2 isoform X1 [Pelobates cultripes]|uniref:DNA excision repair ERCC-6-like 2 isoform X1 n=1 Tax=Pelobates cultripes TaxID=61616 RepID=A0AAD1W5D1_PELCU|nr:DNA excision repair ERCC-6-like 2 isoform X1 [Pelobates cultripes]